MFLSRRLLGWHRVGRINDREQALFFISAKESCSGFSNARVRELNRRNFVAELLGKLPNSTQGDHAVLDRLRLTALPSAFVDHTFYLRRGDFIQVCDLLEMGF